VTAQELISYQQAHDVLLRRYNESAIEEIREQIAVLEIAILVVLVEV